MLQPLTLRREVVSGRPKTQLVWFIPDPIGDQDYFVYIYIQVFYARIAINLS
jgi:hypothetical protein